VYFGVVALDPATAPGAPGETVDREGEENGTKSNSEAKILPAVLSIGYNPFYKNKTRSIACPPPSVPSFRFSLQPRDLN
jgi:riboflavin kinase